MNLSVLSSIIMSPFTAMFFQKLLQVNFLTLFSIRFDYALFNKLMLLLSSFKHRLHVWVSFPKMIPLYLRCVTMIALSGSCFVFIQFFDWVYSNNLLPVSKFDNVFLLIYLFGYQQLGYKHFLSILFWMVPAVHFLLTHHSTTFPSLFYHPLTQINIIIGKDCMLQVITHF